MRGKKLYTLRTRCDTLQFEAETGRLVSFRSAAAPEQEFIESSPEHPVCAIQWLDAQRMARWMDSHSARTIRVWCETVGTGQRLTIECLGLGGLDLDFVGTAVRLHTVARTTTVEAVPVRRHALTVNLPPLSMVLAAADPAADTALGKATSHSTIIKEFT